jgi:hypothetical protein
MINKLFGSEGIMLVVGCIGDWIDALPKDACEKLKVFLYDDMCHPESTF